MYFRESAAGTRKESGITAGSASGPRSGIDSSSGPQQVWEAIAAKSSDSAPTCIGHGSDPARTSPGHGSDLAPPGMGHGSPRRPAPSWKQSTRVTCRAALQTTTSRFA